MILSRLLRLSLLAGWGVLLLGLLLQFVIKDHLFGLRLLFYAMPKPCLLALAVTLLVWPGARKRQRIAAGIVSLLLAAAWTAASWKNGPDQAFSRNESREVRILYWNLCRPQGLHLGMVEMVKELNPHVAAFVEAGTNDMEGHARSYEARLPGYHVISKGQGILWLSRVPSRLTDRGRLGNIGAFARFSVDGLGHDFPLLVADVHPHPFHWRKGQLDDVLLHAGTRSDAVLVGDFNTPLESALLGGYRAKYTHALEAAGHGFKETWPLGLPLLSLDHVWLGQDWEVVDARKIWRLNQSDHAALFVTLRRKEP